MTGVQTCALPISDRSRNGTTHTILHNVRSNLKAIDKTVGLDGLTKLAGGMNDRRTSGMQSGLGRLARRLASRIVTKRNELEVEIEGQPTTKQSKQQLASLPRVGWFIDATYKVDMMEQTLFAAAYMGVTAAAEVILVATVAA